MKAPSPPPVERSAPGRLLSSASGELVLEALVVRVDCLAGHQLLRIVLHALLCGSDLVVQALQLVGAVRPSNPQHLVLSNNVAGLRGDLLLLRAELCLRDEGLLNSPDLLPLGLTL